MKAILIGKSDATISLRGDEMTEEKENEKTEETKKKKGKLFGDPLVILDE